MPRHESGILWNFRKNLAAEENLKMWLKKVLKMLSDNVNWPFQITPRAWKFQEFPEFQEISHAWCLHTFFSFTFKNLNFTLKSAIYLQKHVLCPIFLKTIALFWGCYLDLEWCRSQSVRHSKKCVSAGLVSFFWNLDSKDQHSEKCDVLFFTTNRQTLGSMANTTQLYEASGCYTEIKDKTEDKTKMKKK